jgi:hypothetical protein
MFERYTEKARRVIFFARYEASQFGSSSIETEHLLFGLAREDVMFRSRLLRSDLDSLRKQIESQMPIREKIPTSVDLPLSLPSKQVLAYASEEAEALEHEIIDSGHLVLGLLRIKECLAATFLEQHGVDYDGYREVVRSTGDEAPRPHGVARKRAVERTWNEPQEREPAAPSLRPAMDTLETLLDLAIAYMDNATEAYGRKRLKRKPWSRKEALGHLIDLATAHHQWFARALVEPRLTINAAPQDEWVQAQEYESLSWPGIVDSWVCLNRLLVHILLLIPEEKVNMPCRIGIEEPIPLSKLIERYIARCEDIIGQILSRL